MKKTIFLLGGLLLAICAVSFFSLKENTLTFDEKAHIPAGYSYLLKKDMRVNPEHPPLLKMVAGSPLLFTKINFPHNTWEKSDPSIWWHQFDLGDKLLYSSGNNPDKIVTWTRLPMVLVLALGAGITFFFARDMWGEKEAWIAVLLYSLSPTLLAHGQLVNTDVGIAVAVLASFWTLLRSFYKPSSKNIIIAGVVLGITQLVKFTAVFLVPYFFFCTLLWSLVSKKKLLPLLFLLLKIFLIALAVIYLVYIFVVWNYPPERQKEDILKSLESSPITFLGPTLAKISEINILRPLVQYLFGVGMVYQRGFGGNTTYFLGQVSAESFFSYFPLLWLLKIPISFHILTIIAIAFSAVTLKKFKDNPVEKTISCMKRNFTSVALLGFVAFYWFMTLTGNLNIGIRHLLPVIPLTILLIAGSSRNWLKEPFLKVRWAAFFILLTWQAFSVFKHYPHFIPYYNELAGGPSKGHLYAVDSNLDWGQDLKRLKDWTEKEGIEEIYVDYFGGGSASYYLGEKYKKWDGKKNPSEMKKPAWLAVSATHLMGGKSEARPDHTEDTKYYTWLGEKSLEKRIGYSIFVYRIR